MIHKVTVEFEIDAASIALAEQKILSLIDHDAHDFITCTSTQNIGIRDFAKKIVQ